MIKYTIPKIYKTNSLWYAYFLYEGKEFRYTNGNNEEPDLKERELNYKALIYVLTQRLKNGWNPNDLGEDDNLFLGQFSEKKVIDLIYDLDKDNQNLKRNSKHIKIFCNNGFDLFEYILNEYVKTNRGRLSDIHFFYWSMYDNNPQLIHQRPERFKEWFFENYNEDLGKIKIYDDVKNNDRLIHYSNALDWFKLQKY